MVAYSFHQSFADRVERRLKLSTIRGHRRRHARPGEPMQLFTGMRTKHCRKLVDPDPLCVGVDELRFDLRDVAGVDLLGLARSTNDVCEGAFRGVSIACNGIPIEGDERDAFAASDGFVGLSSFRSTGEAVEPGHDMVMFWLSMYGPVLFEGVRLRWEHRA